MAPPVSFITISSVPFYQVVTQAMFNVANVQWFKYTATVPIVIGLQATKGGTFIPKTTVFQSDGTTVLGHIVTDTWGHWHALRTAADYYIQVVKSTGGSSDFDFTFTADTRPLDVMSFAAGDLVINDDAENFPAVVVSNADAVKFFISAVPAGEFGAILPSNISIWHDRFGHINLTNRIAILDANFAYITSVACGLSGSTNPVVAADIVNNKFYVRGGLSQLWTVSNTGVAVNTGYVFMAEYPEVMAVSPDGTILYWATVSSGINGIRRLNLNTLTPMSDLYIIPGFVESYDHIARTPNGNPGDMFVMPNGNVVTWWESQSAARYRIIVISNAGILLYSHEYLFASNISIDHLAYIDGDSDHIMVWWYINSDLSIGRYGRLNLTTGIIDQDFTFQMFSEGISSEGSDKFGPSNSCTFVRFQGTVVPPSSPDISGIYYINPIKVTKHDSYYNAVEKKIPDPTIRIGPIGE